MIRYCCLTQACGVGLSVASVAWAEPEYGYALFVLDDRPAHALGINAHGHVAGVVDSNSVVDRATLWQVGESVIEFPTLGGDNSWAYDINDNGDVVGWANFEPGGSYYVYRAALWRDGEVVDLGTLGGESSEATATKNHGEWIAGIAEYELGNGKNRPVYWQNEDINALPPHPSCPECITGSVEDVNSSGNIVGSASIGDSKIRATLWLQNGDVIDLGTFPFWGSSYGLGLNDSLEVVGRASSFLDEGHAFYWKDGDLMDIHHPDFPGNYSAANAINNRSEAVGWIGVNQFDCRAFIWEPGEQMRLLQTVVAPRQRFSIRLRVAEDINDAGQICGRSTDGVWDRAFLLSPVRPTMTVSQPTPGLAGEVNSLSIAGVTPGQRVHFLYSRNGGGTRIPGCDLQENALMLDSPKLAGSVVADANGEGVFTFFVPDAARNLGDILIQAVVPGECVVSNLVVEGFE